MPDVRLICEECSIKWFLAEGHQTAEYDIETRCRARRAGASAPSAGRTAATARPRSGGASNQHAAPVWSAAGHALVERDVLLSEGTRRARGLANELAQVCPLPQRRILSKETHKPPEAPRSARGRRRGCPERQGRRRGHRHSNPSHVRLAFR